MKGQNGGTIVLHIFHHKPLSIRLKFVWKSDKSFPMKRHKGWPQCANGIKAGLFICQSTKVHLKMGIQS